MHVTSLSDITDKYCILSVLFSYRCGPLRHMWCMRYEAKHHHFKQLARVIGNFKNIAKTLAYRHQRYICFAMSSPPQYLQDSLVIGPGKCFSSYKCNIYVYTSLLDVTCTTAMSMGAPCMVYVSIHFVP